MVKAGGGSLLVLHKISRTGLKYFSRIPPVSLGSFAMTKEVGKRGTWMTVHGCDAGSVFWQTDHVISRLNLPVQNVLKFLDLISVVIEETTSIHQAEKQFREIILKSDCTFLTSAAVRSRSLFCLSHSAVTRVDKTAFTRSSCSEDANPELGYVI